MKFINNIWVLCELKTTPGSNSYQVSVGRCFAERPVRSLGAASSRSHFVLKQRSCTEKLDALKNEHKYEARGIVRSHPSSPSSACQVAIRSRTAEVIQGVQVALEAVLMSTNQFTEA